MTSYQCSLVNIVLFRTVSQINGDMFAKFSHHLVFNASAEGVPLEFCNGRGARKKLESCSDQNVKEVKVLTQ